MYKGTTMKKVMLLAALALSMTAGFCQKKISWEGLQFTCPENTRCTVSKNGKTSVLNSGTDGAWQMYITVSTVNQFTHQLSAYEADDGGEEFQRMYGGSKKKMLSDITSGTFDFTTGNAQTRCGANHALTIKGKPAGTYGYFTQTECYLMSSLGGYSLFLTNGKKVYHISFENTLPVPQSAEALPAYCAYMEKGAIGPGYYWMKDKIYDFFSDLHNKKQGLPADFLRYQQDWESLLASLRF